MSWLAHLKHCGALWAFTNEQDPRYSYAAYSYAAYSLGTSTNGVFAISPHLDSQALNCAVRISHPTDDVVVVTDP